MSEQTQPQEMTLVQQLQEDLTVLDGVLNVGLGAALARGDVSREQVGATNETFVRVINTCKVLARDNVRLIQETQAAGKLQDRLNQLEAELVQARQAMRRGDKAPANPAELAGEIVQKSNPLKKLRGGKKAPQADPAPEAKEA